MQEKIRIYNSSYNRVFPVPEEKEKGLIAKAKNLGMNYELISAPAHQIKQTSWARKKTSNDWKHWLQFSTCRSS